MPRTRAHAIALAALGLLGAAMSPAMAQPRTLASGADDNLPVGAPFFGGGHNWRSKAVGAADVDGDGVVGFHDLNAVLSDCGDAGPFQAGDVNADLVVDFHDLNQTLAGYGSACPE